MEIKDSKIRFSDRVSNYKKFRPGYPAELFSFLRTKYKIDGAWSIADVGSGTGISTNQLLTEFKCRVFAVEPNENMRNEAELSLNNNPLFRSVDGSSERTGLRDSSVNMITAFQSFHWFDRMKTGKEFTRILKDQKLVTFVWNERLVHGSDFLEGYELFSQKLPEYKKVNHKNIGIKDLEKFIENDEIETISFPNSQRFDLEGLNGRFFSSSYTAAFGTDEYFAQKKELDSLFERCNKNGFIEFVYRTQVYLGKMN